MRAIITLVAMLLVAAGCATPETPSGVRFLSRDEWKANPPVSAMKPHSPKRITIHHTAVKQNPNRTLGEKMKGLQDFSQGEGKLASGGTKPPWSDVPYHYYIDCHGELAEGRPVNYVGDTNTEYNPSGHILVVLEGNFEVEQPTPEQLRSLNLVCRWLVNRFHASPTEIMGHMDFAKTQCPGRNLQALLPELRSSASR